jgi:hypothetical protein
MRNRRVVGGLLAVVFVALVVQASAMNQCPASALGPCARLHLQLMRSVKVPPMALAAAPMRAARERS